MLPDKYGIHEKTVKKADGSYRSLPMLRIHYYIIFMSRVPSPESRVPRARKNNPWHNGVSNMK